MWPSQLWEKTSATSYRFTGGASHLQSSRGWKRSAGWVPAECHLFSRAASPLCWGFNPPDWQTLAAGLPRTSSGLHGRSFTPLFKVPPSFCKGHECVTCLLQASERPSGKAIPWGDARKQHPLEQMEPPHFTGCFVEGGETREQLLPKTQPQDAAARARHAPVHELASYSTAGAWWMTRSCFSMASVEGRTRKFLVCTGN